MPAQPQEIADFFLHISTEGLTHVKLQRLLYFAQAWRLANDEEPLFDEDFVAWSHGPHLESIGKKYADAGRIAELIKPAAHKPKLTEEVADYLRGIWGNYSEMSDPEIEGAALDDVWKAVRSRIESKKRKSESMPKKAIRIVYRKFL